MNAPPRLLALAAVAGLALFLLAASGCGKKEEASDQDREAVAKSGSSRDTGERAYDYDYGAPSSERPPTSARPPVGAEEERPVTPPPVARDGHPPPAADGHPPPVAGDGHPPPAAADGHPPPTYRSIAAPPPYNVVAVRRLLLHGQEIPRVKLPVGIVAFPSKPDSESGRRKSVCSALVGALTTEAEAPPEAHDFMVTHWPTTEEGAWDCDALARTYDLGAAQEAIREARPCPQDAASCDRRLDPRDRGPYLIAWASGEARGTAEAFVVNLSSIDNDDDLQRFCRLWASEMETRPELWSEGHFHSDLIVSIFRDFLDKYGPVILSFPLSSHT